MKTPLDSAIRRRVAILGALWLASRPLLATAAWLGPPQSLCPSTLPSATSVPECRRRIPTALHDSNEAPDEEGRKRQRMELVRSLQGSFYHTATRERPAAAYHRPTGRVHNLPLWRVGWNEALGRTNVLNVHEAMYTNMFEHVLHQEPPWYVGHLYLPQGSRNIKSPAHALRDWESLEPTLASPSTKTTAPHASNRHMDNDDWNEQSSVLGALLRIVDYRRMGDGRLLLLVQALERFVVTDVIQTLPYSVANVQIVPDLEEVDADVDWIGKESESSRTVPWARGEAVRESFDRWHRYEYDAETVLPLPVAAELSTGAVLGTALRQVLPHARYARDTNVAALALERLPDGPSIEHTEPTPESLVHDSAHGLAPTPSSHCTLEQRLLQKGILREPFLNEELQALTLDDLERRLWIVLDSYFKTSRAPLSSHLLGLLPPEITSWPKGFVLQHVCHAMQANTDHDGGDATDTNKFVHAVSVDYPKDRRQKRLSYTAASLLEDPHDGAATTALRRLLLACPTTKSRLCYVLQILEGTCGAFQ